MASRAELKMNAVARVKAARTLMNAGDNDLGIEMLVMALECMLKACICKTLCITDYPDNKSGGKNNDIPNFFRTHDFDRLLLLSGMEKDFQKKVGNLHRFQNWSTATTTWDISMRYAIGTFSTQDAERVYDAMMDKRFGVLSWVKQKRAW